MPWISRVIEDGQADSFSFDRTIVIAPIGAFSPGGSIAIARAVNNVAVADFALPAHGFSQPGSHGAFFGIAEGYLVIGSVQTDFEIHQAFVIMARSVDAQGAFVRADQCAIGGNPFVARANEA